jgi:hypothetical protein
MEDNDIENNIKIIPFGNTTPCHEKSDARTLKKRVITNTKKWVVNETDEQINYIRCDDNKENKLVSQQIRQKIAGYRSQDMKKKLYNKTVFVNLEHVIDLLLKCENKCFYCKSKMNILYENVRDPKQWTLERIDNNNGHNIGNVVIACLECNLRRRCIYHERFLFTKQLSIEKIS